MVNYGKGKIYKIEPICEHEDDAVYFGSTSKNYLSQRMDSHRSKYKQWKNGKTRKVRVYDLFDKYGIENCKIYLVENYPCDSKEELQSREGYYIKNNVCVNKRVEGRTKEQYYADNKNKLQKYGKEYKLKNKDKIKKYYNDNKEKLIEKSKKYKKENKDKLLEKFDCDCGGKYCHTSKARHNKSVKHKKYQQMTNQLAVLNKDYADMINRHKQLYLL